MNKKIVYHSSAGEALGHRPLLYPSFVRLLVAAKVIVRATSWYIGRWRFALFGFLRQLLAALGSVSEHFFCNTARLLVNILAVPIPDMLSTAFRAINAAWWESAQRPAARLLFSSTDGSRCGYELKPIPEPPSCVPSAFRGCSLY